MARTIVRDALTPVDSHNNLRIPEDFITGLAKVAIGWKWQCWDLKGPRSICLALKFCFLHDRSNVVLKTTFETNLGDE